jgi:hypothetical protein
MMQKKHRKRLHKQIKTMKKDIRSIRIAHPDNIKFVIDGLIGFFMFYVMAGILGQWVDWLKKINWILSVILLLGLLIGRWLYIRWYKRLKRNGKRKRRK